MGKAIYTSLLTRVPVAHATAWANKCLINVPILLMMRSHVSVVFDFQLSLSVCMHLYGRGNISNNGDICNELGKGRPRRPARPTTAY